MSASRSVLIAALVVALVLLGWAIRRRPASPSPEGTTTGLNVVVVAIDSFDPAIAAHYAEQLELTELRRLINSGYAGVTMAAPPFLPDACWMQLASGRPLTDSEVERALEDPGGRLFGVMPDVARIASEQGATCVVVGWPGSWPVGNTSATVIAPFAPATPDHEVGLPPAILAGAPDDVSDPDLAETVDAVVRIAEERVSGIFDESIVVDDAQGDWEGHVNALEWAFLSDLVSLDLGARLLAERQPDLTLIYLGGLDVASHRFLGPARPESFGGIPDDVIERYGDVLGNYYSFIDGAFERIHRLRERNTLLIACSCYGIAPTVGGPGRSGTHRMGPVGFINIRGPRIVRPPSAATVSVHDVAPTVLAALGLTIPSDVAGRVLVDGLPEGMMTARPPRYGEASGQREPSPPPEETAVMEQIAAERLSRL